MKRFCLSIFLLLLWYTPVQAQAPEYQIKAAMLANFALFVEWPPTAFATEDSPFVACVLGKDPFGPLLKHELGERIGTHPVETRQVDKSEAARQCHLVFISSSEEPRLKQVLASLESSAALIVSDVGDSSDFCRQGGMIALVMQGSKVRFDLNSKGAASVGLKINSKLMRVARSTDCGEGR